MQKYLIGQAVQVKTSSKGNTYKVFNLKAPDGKITNNVAAFTSFPDYEKIVANAFIDGELKEKDYNGSKSYTLEGQQQPKQGFGGGGAAKAVEIKTRAIEKAQDNKFKSIEKAQENKEYGVMISSTARMATDTTLSQFANEEFDAEQFKMRWLEWRKWFIRNWENDGDAPGITSAGEHVAFSKEAEVEDIRVEDIPF